MSLKTEVKVGHISNLSDARYCAGMGVQYLGFSMDRNTEHYVDQKTLKSIKDWIVGPVIVGEFPDLNVSKNDIPDILEDIDCIEISEPASISASAEINLPLILRLDIATFQSKEELEKIMARTKDGVLFFILEKSSVSLVQDTDIIRLASQYKIMIGYGIDKNSIHTWINGTDIFGISLKGGTEIKPGYKDYDELAVILEQIEVD